MTDLPTCPDCKRPRASALPYPDGHDGHCFMRASTRCLTAQLDNERDRANGFSEASRQLLADLATVGQERDAAVAVLRDAGEEIATLHNDIDEHLPAYTLDDGTDDEANERERIEYAGDEIRSLKIALRNALNCITAYTKQKHGHPCSHAYPVLTHRVYQ